MFHTDLGVLVGEPLGERPGRDIHVLFEKRKTAGV